MATRRTTNHAGMRGLDPRALFPGLTSIDVFDDDNGNQGEFGDVVVSVMNLDFNPMAMGDEALESAINECKVEITSIDNKIKEQALKIANDPMNAVDYLDELGTQVNRQRYAESRVRAMIESKNNRAKDRDERKSFRAVVIEERL